MKKFFTLLLICSILVFIIISCAKKNPTESQPQFDNFQDEVEYIIKSNFTFGGVAAGIIKGDETFSIFHGTKSKNSDEPPDENTVYEIGSVTKTFTATLLANTVVNGTVRLHDNVQDYLPADSVTMPTYNGLQISFWHLATHTAGLPKNFSDAYPSRQGYLLMIRSMESWRNTSTIIF